MRSERGATIRSTVRGGFTIAEALVALVVLAVGVLALVSGTAYLTRAEHAARVAETSAAMLADRVETVAALPCRDSIGTAVAPPFVERWRVVRTDDVTTFSDTVMVRTLTGLSATGLTTIVRCAP